MYAVVNTVTVVAFKVLLLINLTLKQPFALAKYILSNKYSFIFCKALICYSLFHICKQYQTQILFKREQLYLTLTIIINFVIEEVYDMWNYN